MYRRLAADEEELPALLEAAQRHASGLLSIVGERDVLSRQPAQQVHGVSLPEHGGGLRAAMEEFTSRWEPAFSASAGPRYLGFVTGGVTPAALAGDWLTSTWDQNSITSLDDTGQRLEQETLNWLRELFGLPTEQRGMFVSGATMSNMVGLAVAREWIAQKAGISCAEQGVHALGAVTVLSGSAHSSIPKALSMLGMGRNALHQVPVVSGREAVDPQAVEHRLRAVEGPCIVVANAGTVNTVDFDDLDALLALRERYDFWLHVDAAFGAFAALSADHSHLVSRIGEADSICIDLHKWLNVPYDSALQFTRRPDLQAAVFQNAAAYLGGVETDPDAVHLTPENSRRLRAVPAWFTLNAYGRAGYREIVARNIACARALSDAVDATPQLRRLAPTRMNVVCFTHAVDPSAGRLDRLMRDLSADVFLSPTVYQGVPALRAAFSNWRTTDRDVLGIVAKLRLAARE